MSQYKEIFCHKLLIFLKNQKRWQWEGHNRAVWQPLRSICSYNNIKKFKKTIGLNDYSIVGLTRCTRIAMLLLILIEFSLSFEQRNWGLNKLEYSSGKLSTIRAQPRAQAPSALSSNCFRLPKTILQHILTVLAENWTKKWYGVSKRRGWLCMRLYSSTTDKRLVYMHGPLKLFV